VFAGEHPPGSSKADRDFVEDQKRSMAIAGGANALPIVERRNKGRAPHGFGDHSRHVAFSFQHVLDVVGTGQIACGAASEGTMAIVGRRHVFTARKERADAAAENAFPADGNAVEGCAMERFPHRDGLEATGRGTGQLESHAYSGGAPGGKQDPLQATRCEAGQFAGEFDRRDAGVTSRAEA